MELEARMGERLRWSRGEGKVDGAVLSPLWAGRLWQPPSLSVPLPSGSPNPQVPAAGHSREGGRAAGASGLCEEPRSSPVPAKHGRFPALGFVVPAWWQCAQLRSCCLMPGMSLRGHTRRFWGVMALL